MKPTNSNEIKTQDSHWISGIIEYYEILTSCKTLKSYQIILN